MVIFFAEEGSGSFNLVQPLKLLAALPARMVARD